MSDILKTVLPVQNLHSRVMNMEGPAPEPEWPAGEREAWRLAVRDTRHDAAALVLEYDKEMQYKFKQLEQELEVAKAALLVATKVTDACDLRGPMTPTQRNHAAALYANMQPFGQEGMETTVRALAIIGYMNGLYDADFGADAPHVKCSLTENDVQWIVNDLGELGVKIDDQCFFCYKGDSLQYKGGHTHEDGTPMLHRNVGKREFGEVVYPAEWQKRGYSDKRYKLELTYTPGLSFGKADSPAHQWLPIPVPGAK